MKFLVKRLPIEWQARLWFHIMRRRYGRTSHFKLEAIKALRSSAKLPLVQAKAHIDRAEMKDGGTASLEAQRAHDAERQA